MADVSIDPVQTTVVGALLTTVVVLIRDMKKNIEESVKEKKKELEERLENLAKATADSLKSIAESLSKLEDRTRWMIRQNPPTPDDPYTGRPRNPHWTPVSGVEVLEEKKRR